MKSLISRSNLNKLFLVIVLGLVLVYQLIGGYKYFNFSQEGQILQLRIQDFVTLFLSIIVEAFPFIILGVAISTLVQIGFFSYSIKQVKKHKLILFPFYLIYYFCNKIDSKYKNNRFYSHIKISIMGIFLPVCECGNIPVARSLLLSGFSVSQSITFLLAAPIVNPITFLTTLEAFNFDPSISIIRILAGFIIANFIGILLSYKKPQNELLELDFYQEVCEAQDNKHSKNRIEEFLNIFQKEFLEIFKVLIIGAMLASLSQTFIPRDLIVSVGQNPILSILAMIILAFVISICSNVDAFFALSYANTFTMGSIMAFLVFGPMIDIKILTMMKSTYKTKLLILVTLFVFLLSFLTALIINFIR